MFFYRRCYGLAQPRVFGVRVGEALRLFGVEVDGGAESATARSYFTVLQQVEDTDLRPIISGSYNDVFKVVDGAWWFDTREMVVGLVGDLSRHLLIDR